jgi:NAD(P)-dependent dehydrogenase (short-subunit alcohol dehydrogenase family)
MELIPIDAIRHNFETNVFAPIALMQRIAPILRSQGGGRIVNISSVSGRIVSPFSSVYAATKHALEGISDGMRLELAPFGIKVVVIQPGFIVSEFLDVSWELSRSVIESNSPYSAMLERQARGYKRSQRLAGHPDVIARLVIKTLKVRNPRPRYAAPLHAHVALCLRRWMPEALFDYMLRREMGLKRN